MGKVFGIDEGHGLDGYPNSGAVGKMSESVQTRRLGKRVKEIIKAHGHVIVDCTIDKPASNDASLKERVRLANAQRLDLFVSLHFNAGGGTGTEVLTYKSQAAPEAVNIIKNMETIGFKNRGIKDGSGLYVIKNTRCKAILVETCFVDTDKDVALYEQKFEQVANAIAYGIMGMTYKDTTDKDNQEVDAMSYTNIRLSGGYKIMANENSPIAGQMKELTKELQQCAMLPRTGIANGILVAKLPEFIGIETKGSVTTMQKLLELKGYGKEIATGTIGPACKGAINRFKEANGIAETAKLFDAQCWLKILEY